MSQQKDELNAKAQRKTRRLARIAILDGPRLRQSNVTLSQGMTHLYWTEGVLAPPSPAAGTMIDSTPGRANGPRTARVQRVDINARRYNPLNHSSRDLLRYEPVLDFDPASAVVGAAAVGAGIGSLSSGMTMSLRLSRSKAPACA